ncbi:hypothetical protein COCC4DRAFT_29719 [Bipolaris maydis ATCC 48331]|uniref:Uncharacterized protein n=1 Tax=Cochliobolus heterostrophus (strain C4 / ATCC 48331 / race T) TaxID=665024 RepID=N4X9T0_COCH4|nr:uncharacterized protein COCC4DRAFT_29719 [Bipolaris maydis ATCC 48331]ENI09784.1 hypothetical protein COCC4DRAFT_29719 [Bipolaris maydis ATCC 48331]
MGLSIVRKKRDVDDEKRRSCNNIAHIARKERRLCGTTLDWKRSCKDECITVLYGACYSSPPSRVME